MGPIESYLSIDEIIRVARLSGADAIHPGYGLLSESPEFAEACADSRHHLHRPDAGDHAHARQQGRGAQPGDRGRRAGDAGDRAAARRHGRRSRQLAAEIGYPLMLKASWGGGGRGMRAIRDEADLAREVTEGKREAKAAFGKDEVYLEKLIERARHVEVQILGDTHGNARASVRARLLGPAPQPEGRRARAGALSRRGAARRSSAATR